MRRALVFLVFITLFPCLMAAVEITSASSIFSDPEDDALIMEENEGITVTGSQIPEKARIFAGREEIETIAEGGAADVPALLQAMGLSAGRYAGKADVSLRGLDSQRLTILVDSVPLASSLSGEADLTEIDLENVESVEITHGGGGVYAGSAVVNITTRKTAKSGLDFEIGARNTGFLGSFLDTQRLFASLGWGREGVSAKISAFGSLEGNHFLVFDTIDGVETRKTGSEAQNLGGSASFSLVLPDKITKIEASSSVFSSSRGVPLSGYAAVSVKEEDFSTNTSAKISAPRAFHDDFSLEALLTSRYQRIAYSSSAHQSEAVSASSRVTWYPASSLSLAGAANYVFAYTDSTDSGEHIGNSGGLSLDADFVMTRFRLTSGAGLVSNGKSLVPVPHLALVWLPLESLSLNTGVYRIFKFPDAEDLWWESSGYSGNPDLKPEDGAGLDFDVKFEPDIAKINKNKSEITLGLSFFGRFIENSIHWSSKSGVWRPENIEGGAVIIGGSLSALAARAFFAPFDKVSLSVFYQYLDTRLLCYGYTWADAKNIPYQSPHTLNSQVSLHWKNGSLSLTARYEDIRFTDTANIGRLPPYLAVDAAISQRFLLHYSIFLAAKNLLNTRYETRELWPEPGVNFTLGFKFAK